MGCLLSSSCCWPLSVPSNSAESTLPGELSRPAIKELRFLDSVVGGLELTLGREVWPLPPPPAPLPTPATAATLGVVGRRCGSIKFLNGKSIRPQDYLED